MLTIEFDTSIQNILDAIPQEKRHQLNAYPVGNAVRVTIQATQGVAVSTTKKNRLQDANEKGYDNFLDYLIDHPIELPHPIRFTRDELHER